MLCSSLICDCDAWCAVKNTQPEAVASKRWLVYNDGAPIDYKGDSVLSQASTQREGYLLLFMRLGEPTAAASQGLRDAKDWLAAEAMKQAEAKERKQRQQQPRQGLGLEPARGAGGQAGAAAAGSQSRPARDGVAGGTGSGSSSNVNGGGGSAGPSADEGKRETRSATEARKRSSAALGLPEGPQGAKKARHR